jgi:hypothetical protein
VSQSVPRPDRRQDAPSGRSPTCIDLYRLHDLLSCPTTDAGLFDGCEVWAHKDDTLAWNLEAHIRAAEKASHVGIPKKYPGVWQSSPAALSTKRLGILKEVVPKLSRGAVRWNGANPALADPWKLTQHAATALGNYGLTLQAPPMLGSDGLTSR